MFLLDVVGPAWPGPLAGLTPNLRYQSALRYQSQVDPAVLLALVLDLAKLDAADLGGVSHVRAATGLKVDPGDVEEADAAVPGRRFDRHGAHQLGLAGESSVADPARHAIVAGRDEGVELRLDLGLVERGAGDVEIEPSLAVGDLAAVTAPGTTAQRRWRQVCMRISR